MSEDWHHVARDAVIFGVPPETVAQQYNVSVAEVLDLFTAKEFKQYKALQVARNEAQERLLMQRIKADPNDDGAHSLRLKAAARQSALIGMDAAHRVDVNGDVKVTIDWAGPDRLSYRRETIDVTPAPAQLTADASPDAWKVDPEAEATKQLAEQVADRELSRRVEQAQKVEQAKRRGAAGSRKP